MGRRSHNKQATLDRLTIDYSIGPCVKYHILRSLTTGGEKTRDLDLGCRPSERRVQFPPTGAQARSLFLLKCSPPRVGSSSMFDPSAFFL